MSELEKRESQFSSVMDRGESLIISHHPASQVIEAHMLAMQNKWAWLLQLTLCLETHLKHTGTSQRFFGECATAEEFLTHKEEILNNHFSQAEFKLEEGEELLKEMQTLRDELHRFEDDEKALQKEQETKIIAMFEKHEQQSKELKKKQKDEVTQLLDEDEVIKGLKGKEKIWRTL